MRVMHALAKYAYMALIVTSVCCGEDETVPSANNQLASGEPKDYLKFDAATKLEGEYPVALDGTLKINFKDTLYLIDNHSYKSRISVLHSTVVSGFYVWVIGTKESMYYDVPAVAAEGKDTIDVFYIGFDVPEQEVTLPYSVEIKILPHGPDGTALEEFVRVVTVEEEVEKSSCPITTGTQRWSWLYTEVHKVSGDLFQVSAPWFQATFGDEASGYYYAKCCIQDPNFGLIEAYPGDPTREGICEFGNPLYKRVYIDGAYYLKAYDELFLFENGEFWHYSASLTSNFIPQKSRICDLFAYYELDFTAYEKIGTHDYMPGASSIKMTTVTAKPPFGPVPPFGNFINSCHLLIFTIGSEENYTIIYQKQADGTDPEMFDAMSYLDVWFEL